jgi:flagellar assembly protein FliH
MADNDVVRELVLPSVIADRAAVAERDGFDRGFAHGEQAAREAERLRTDTQIAKLAGTIAELSSLRAEMLRRAEQDVVRLALAIAERIVRREVQVDRQLLLTMAETAARKLANSPVINIHMHPDDLLSATSGRGAASADGPIRMLADANMAPGGCLVQSVFGTIDVGIDAQMREIARQLLGVEADSSGESGANG